MKINHILLISLLIVGIFVPAVSADEIIENELYIYYVGEHTTSTEVTYVGAPGGTDNYALNSLGIRHPYAIKPIELVYEPYHKISCSNKSIFYDKKPFVIQAYGNTIATGYRTLYLPEGASDQDYIVWTFDTWNRSYSTATITSFGITILWGDSPSYSISGGGGAVNVNNYPNQKFWFGLAGPYNRLIYHGKYTCTYENLWTNKISAIKNGEEAVILSVEKTIDNVTSISKVSMRSLVKSEPYYVGALDGEDVSVAVSLNEAPYEISVYSAVNDKWYNRTVFQPDSPTDPTEPNLRTGTVTMTDHNGTSIHGFEVTVVNRYTGESFTVTTDTDVAVIDLPMDRTTEIRNPQTGEYEVAPVGYYTFYGQAPGYKMLFDDGIKVVVTPVKYSSYKLCDILVTSDSGPLTGKHKFQIRSRADNSILQTGTISAKSATTGEWYNTSVSGGIGTLILAYDTTSILSEYAGLYYVYATSPGYEDSDYGTQISVYPHTVSEIKTVLLTPIGGVSTPDNVTLRIQAVSETGPGVVNAEIFIAGVYGAGKDVWNTYTASSTGYLEVSVPGNSTYDIVASGDGFYDSARRIEVFTEDPGLIEIKLYLSGYPTLEPTPTIPPTDWPTDPPTTPPTGGIPDEDDDSDGFMMESVRGIANLFGVSFGVGKTILGMLLALGIGTATAKHLRGGAQEFGMGMLGGVVLGVLIGLLPIWVLVLLVLIVGLWIGQRYMSGGDS